MRLTAFAALTSAFVLPAVAFAALPPVAITYNNETDTAAELDYAVLQFPGSFIVAPATATPVIYGQIYEAGVTDPSGPPAGAAADVGYGPPGSDPRTTPWTWFPATYNVQVGNNDEYQSSFISPLAGGQYSYTYRFSLNPVSGIYTLGDLNGAGSNVGLTFETSQLGVLTVTPEPTTLGAIASAGALFLRRRR